MYANRGLLLEAIALGDDDDLFRYHLQAGRQQVAELHRAFEENPKDLGILLNLGHAYYQIGDYEKSTKLLREVLAVEPEQGMANLYLGYNLLELGQLQEAKKVLKAAVKKDPRQLRSVMQQVALIELLMKLEKNPESTDLLNAVAQFYNIKNEFRKSLDYSLKVLKKDPMDKQALQSAVFSYRGLGEPGEVIGYGVRYDMADPEDMHFQYIMAEMYIQTLRCEKAIPYLKGILKKDDTYQNAQQWLKQCEDKVGGKRSP